MQTMLEHDKNKSLYTAFPALFKENPRALAVDPKIGFLFGLAGGPMAYSPLHRSTALPGEEVGRWRPWPT